MCLKTLKPEMTAVGFEPTQLALVELESTPLDHAGKLSLVHEEHVCTIALPIAQWRTTLGVRSPALEFCASPPRGNFLLQRTQGRAGGGTRESKEMIGIDSCGI